MKRIPTLLVIALCLSAPSLARAENATVGQLLQAVRGHPENTNWTVIPIAGSSRGQTGALFHADLALSGSHGFYYDARIAIAWLPLDRDASTDAVRFITLSSVFDSTFTLFHDGLGNDGFGAIVLAAVDANGALDPQGNIEANVRVWSASACVGETSLGYSSKHWLGADRGMAIGLRLGNGFRANAGIVNGDVVEHRWRIHSASLEDGSASDLEVTVPASSSVIVSLSPAVAGAIALTIEAEAPGLPWTGWGASVDNSSGDAWYSAIAPF